LDKFHALVVAKPTLPFNEKEKYVIDQYIMNGGKVIWMLDATNANMDSLANKGSFLAHPLRDLNLAFVIFHWGLNIATRIF
jgi:hypothetical protein